MGQESILSDEFFDYREIPSDKNTEDVLDAPELLEEVLDLEELDEEFETYPWSIFKERENRTPDLSENKDFLIQTKRMETSPIPSCVVDLNLKIIWENREFSEGLLINDSSLHHHLPEIFRSDGEENLIVSLKMDLEKPETSYSWKGRLCPFNEPTGDSFLRAMIQPLLYTEDELPVAFLVQWDVITKEYKDLLQKTFLSLLEASKMKDNDTGHHIERVNSYSVLLAENLRQLPDYSEIDDVFIEDIGFLAAMHDVGKIGTPDDILNKTGPLDDWEREIMNEHTKNGAYILSTYPKPMAMQIARSHHEKWDGSGYPYGMIGEMIPLCARIVCIADVYDALRSKRSYKEAFSHEKSKSIILQGKGTHFDPQMIEVFEQIHDEFNVIFEEQMS